MENNVTGIFRPVRTCFVGQAHGSFQDFHDLFRPSITRHHAHLPQATNSFVFDDGLHVMETARRKTTKATTMMSAHGMQKQRPKTTKKTQKGPLKTNVVPVISLVVDGAILKHFDHVGRCQWFHVFQLFVRLFQYFFLRFPLQFLFANVPKNKKNRKRTSDVRLRVQLARPAVNTRGPCLKTYTCKISSRCISSIMLSNSMWLTIREP